MTDVPIRNLYSTPNTPDPLHVIEFMTALFDAQSVKNFILSQLQLYRVKTDFKRFIHPKLYSPGLEYIHTASTCDKSQLGRTHRH